MLRNEYEIPSQAGTRHEWMVKSEGARWGYIRPGKHQVLDGGPPLLLRVSPRPLGKACFNSALQHECMKATHHYREFESKIFWWCGWRQHSQPKPYAVDTNPGKYGVRSAKYRSASLEPARLVLHSKKLQTIDGGSFPSRRLGALTDADRLRVKATLEAPDR